MVTTRTRKYSPAAEESSGGSSREEGNVAKKNKKSSSRSSRDAASSSPTAVNEHPEFMMHQHQISRMVDLNPIGETSSQGASALVKRCMRLNGWDELKAKKILVAYRDFMSLKKELKDWDAKVLSPCYLVEQMWHCHASDVVNYCHDVMLLCGHVVGRNPDGDMGLESTQKTRELLQQRGKYDADVWEYSPEVSQKKSSSSDNIMITILLQGEAKRVKRCQKLEELFNESYNDVTKLAFFYNDRQLSGNATPDTLGMCDGDIIDVANIIRISHSYDTSLRVRDLSGELFLFRLYRESTKVNELLHAYASYNKVDQSYLHLQLHGKRLRGTDTVASMTLTSSDTLLITNTVVLDDNPTMTVRVTCQWGNVISYKVTPETRTQELIDANAKRVGIDGHNLRLLWEGERIQNGTIASLGLEDNDCISCFLMQGAPMKCHKYPDLSWPRCILAQTCRCPEDSKYRCGSAEVMRQIV